MPAYVKNYDPTIDFRKHPELYKVGRGEQGVLMCQPFKAELLPLWRFKTEADAKKSAEAITARWRQYMNDDEFPGADLARKYLQMGFTRARRYARHKGGRKYDKATGEELPVDVVEDAEKNAAAAVFKVAWDAVEADTAYADRKAAWKAAEKAAAAKAKGADAATTKVRVGSKASAKDGKNTNVKASTPKQRKIARHEGP